jgi:PST family polysaccharide transporter
MVWGVFLRLLAWPLGYWMLARGAPRTVVIVELGSNLLMAALPLLLIRSYGLVGAAIAYFTGYLAYAIIIVAVARKRSGRWLSLRTLGMFAAAASILILAQSLARAYPGMYWGAIPTALVATGCAWIYFRVLADQDDE